MELDFEARSATFEEAQGAIPWISPIQRSRKKLIRNSTNEQCLEHLCLAGLVFVPKERNWGGNWGGVPLFVPLCSQVAMNFLRKQGGIKGLGGFTPPKPMFPVINCTPPQKSLAAKRRAFPNRAAGEIFGFPRQKWCFPAKKS